MENYVETYNAITQSGGWSAAGADTFRLDKLILELCGYNDTMSVLDYGCGWGSLLTIIDPPDYHGVDISPTMVRLAREEFPKKVFDLCHPGTLSVPEKDIIIAHSVFTHIPDSIIDDCLSDIKNNLKDSGIAIIDIFIDHVITDSNLVFRKENEWLLLLRHNGLIGKYIAKRNRSEVYTHYYYKVGIEHG